MKFSTKKIPQISTLSLFFISDDGGEEAAFPSLNNSRTKILDQTITKLITNDAYLTKNCWRKPRLDS